MFALVTIKQHWIINIMIESHFMIYMLDKKDKERTNNPLSIKYSKINGEFMEF